jgi:acyl phosphate:glycerol-3-phosphate acyltransferase
VEKSKDADCFVKFINDGGKIIMMSDIWIYMLAGLVGYLSGSISFARLVSRIASPGREVGDIKVQLPGAGIYVESDAMSATTVRLEFGAKFGCLVGTFDIFKALIPSLVFKLVYPDSYAYLVASGMAVVGHNWPVYYRFKGGRGLSSVLGGFLVMDWLGVLVTNVIGFLIGFPSRNMLIITGAGIVLMIPWIMIRTHDWVLVIYTILMNIIFWGSMTPELKSFQKIVKAGKMDEFSRATEVHVIHEDGTERVDKFTLESMVQSMKAMFSKNQEKKG